MVYALLGVLLTGFSAGFGLEYKLNEAKVWRLESAISRQKTESEAMLTAIAAKVEMQKAEQINANQELEDARNSSIATINALHADRDTVAGRLRNAVSGACRDRPVPPSDHPGQLQGDAAETHSFSAGFAGFLSGQAFEADTLAADYNALLQFVQSGCGLND
jgi:hypothetical protein